VRPGSDATEEEEPEEDHGVGLQVVTILLFLPFILLDSSMFGLSTFLASATEIDIGERKARLTTKNRKRRVGSYA
jgi:hypothetical protein